MSRLKLRYQVLLVLGVTLTAVFAGVAYFYTYSQERAIIQEYERVLHKLTDSVSKGLEAIMVENHAEIMREYARRLKTLRDISEVVILRTDGSEAFRNNATIDHVNGRLGNTRFEPRAKQEHIQKIDPADPEFRRVLSAAGTGVFQNFADDGERQLVFLDAIPNGPRCHRCHGSAETLRGVVRVTSTLSGVETEIFRMRLQSIMVIGLALILTMLFTGYVLGRSVVAHIESVTGAMAKISSGNFESAVPLGGGGEIRRMADSFNQMTSNLKEGHDLLLRERDKLTTIIRAAREAIVVTDAAGEIVLINSATNELLGKSDGQIRREGFLHLLDDTELLERLLHAEGESKHTATIDYRDRVLLVSAATIADGKGQLIGSAAMIRDVTKERRMMAELERISITDALTDVFNRRYLDVTLASEFERARRTGKPLSVLLLDVDHFKHFNDTHGHDQGDRVLQAVGAGMKNLLRGYDTPCRYGGEEFVAILPDTNSADAATVGERLRKAVAAMEVDGLRVTISIGAATFPSLDVATPEQLLEAADAALYQSKNSGRNRLTIADAGLLDKNTAAT